jgi:hypothetical protein
MRGICQTRLTWSYPHTSPAVPVETRCPDQKHGREKGIDDQETAA